MDEHPTEHPDGWRAGDRVEVAGWSPRREGKLSKHIWATGHIISFGIQNINIVRVKADCGVAAKYGGAKTRLAHVNDLTRIDEYDD
jgi:hypothetical protein